MNSMQSPDAEINKMMKKLTPTGALWVRISQDQRKTSGRKLAQQLDTTEVCQFSEMQDQLECMGAEERREKASYRLRSYGASVTRNHGHPPMCQMERLSEGLF